MNKENINTTLIFIGLILIQIVVLNHINFLGYINPFLYVIFIFLYPIKKQDGVLILLSFLMGLSIDIFSNSGGINAAATLFIAFIRIPVLKSVIGKREIDYSATSLFKLPYFKSFIYILILKRVKQKELKQNGLYYRCRHDRFCRRQLRSRQRRHH